MPKRGLVSHTFIYQDDGAPAIQFKKAASSRVTLRGSSKVKTFSRQAPISGEDVAHFQISYWATAASIAAKLSLSSIFGGSVSASDIAIFYDAIATTPNILGPDLTANGKYGRGAFICAKVLCDEG